MEESSRRNFLGGLAGLAGSFLIEGSQQPQQNQVPPGPPPKLTKVHDDLYMIENRNATVSDIGKGRKEGLQ